MAITVDRAKPEHAAELGRIMYEAFAGISQQHGFPPDFPELAVAQQVMQMICSRPDITGFAAVDEDGRVIGSNFVWMEDPVAGVGPITIDPSRQRRGVGRMLMNAVIDHARSQGKEMIRLVQDSFNMTSLSLYASLGFTVREPLALMQASPKIDASGVRRATPDDIDAMDALCRPIFKVTRRAEIASSLHAPFPTLVRERSGRIVAYLIPGIIGHGAAETDEDALAITGAMSQLPPPAQVFFAPLRQATLHRKALAAGCRMVKVMQLMSIGPYEEPSGTWLPSVMY